MGFQQQKKEGVRMKMIRLKGAAELRKLVLKKWSSSTIKKGSGGYVRKFRCPQCGGEASETLSRSPVKEEDLEEWWAVEWDSPCGYVFDSLSRDDLSSEFIEVRTLDGAIVGKIDVSSPPPWPRFEPRENEEDEITEFDTLWQAMNASVQEFRLLGAIQKLERHKRKRSRAR
jgi:hypothetical protein